MTRPTLQPNPPLVVGSKGEQVRLLQVALNTRYKDLNLRTDGEFDAPTSMAIDRFQDENWLVTSGAADLCTQNALLGKETYEPIRHERKFIPQPDKMSCWAACTAMLKGSSVAAVKAATPPDLLDEYGALDNASDREDWRESTQAYAYWHKLGFRAPANWPVQKFTEMLADGPVMVDTLWNQEKYGSGPTMGSPGHFTLVVGCRGNGEVSGRGTTLMVYDPWPPGMGARRRVTYHAWISEVALRTYRIFY